MKIFYALYDPARPTNSGYWTWCAPELSAKLLESFYYDTACQHRPDFPNSLSENDLWGGMVRLNETWTVVYRFLNGGNDLRGRPERFVIMTAWIRSEETLGRDLFPLLESAAFRSVLAEAPKCCPIPTPRTLDDDWHGEQVGADPVQVSRLIESDSLTLDGPNAFSTASSLFANLPEAKDYYVKFKRVSDDCHVEIGKQKNREGKVETSPEAPPQAPLSPPDSDKLLRPARKNILTRMFFPLLFVVLLSLIIVFILKNHISVQSNPKVDRLLQEYDELSPADKHKFYSQLDSRYRQEFGTSPMLQKDIPKKSFWDCPIWNRLK